MSLHYGVPVPKPEPMRRTKARKDGDDAQQLQAFRDAVWQRESSLWGFERKCARCQWCHAIVYRANEPRGEVHHKIPRSRCTREQRYDPTNGALLCGYLVNDCHGKAQRHEITI